MNHMDIEKVKAEGKAWLADRIIFNRPISVEERFERLIAAIEQVQAENQSLREVLGKYVSRCQYCDPYGAEEGGE